MTPLTQVPRRNGTRSEQLLLFGRNFLKHPRMLGSVIPSSRFLVDRVLGQVDWPRAGTIVEYGPGVGTLTREILRRLGPEATLVAIETNGDFVSYLEETTEHYDLIFSAGVLYHMRDPIGLIANLARHTERLYMWTHYYDDAIIQGTPHLKSRYTVHTPAETGGFRYTLHRQDYQHSLGVAGFCGGSAEFSHWITKLDLLNAISYFGFRDIRTAHEMLDHPHGPCLDIVAIK